ncbi:hypothetical protein Kisp02_54580 [Kineosporia sp. NBRC 101731]|nr:hypothetical protein Kisp02_54580 [Kineosporia sp. NBRC 101731]
MTFDELVRSMTVDGVTAVPAADGQVQGDPIADLTAWAEKLRRARQVLVCEPHREAAVREAVAALPWAALCDVRSSDLCPQGQVLVLPEAEPVTYVPALNWRWAP